MVGFLLARPSHVTTIFVGVVALIVGFVALFLGNGVVALGAFGVFALCLTSASLIVGIITVPAGILMILGAIAWASGFLRL
jgi:hypothetical protein